MSAFLAGLSPEEFLGRHWQKAPLLVRQALPGYAPPVGPEELAGLCLEAEVESRVVQERGGRWELSRGPFEEAFFEELPASHWTLLVQDLDQHVPEVAELFRLLDFLPSHRLDDVMASYAVREGSVGPHYDNYDVFLLQVQGRRRWQIASKFDASRVRDDTELCILSEFFAEQEWVLEPGDMLYLPPRVAHYGVALDPCVTFSLGCRAPSAAEIIAHFARRVLDQMDEDVRYEDPDLERPRAPCVLDGAALGRVRGLLHRHLELSDDELARGFGTLTTQPKALFEREPFEPATRKELRRRLSTSPSWWKRKGSRWLSYLGSSQVFLFVDGQEFVFPKDALAVAEHLCAARSFTAEELQGWLGQPTLTPPVERLLALALLEPAPDE